jgi:septum formation inhibitor-activating ATPase MinD
MKLFPTSDNFGIHICNNDSAIVFASPEPTVSREADKIVGCLLKGLLLCASGKK